MLSRQEAARYIAAVGIEEERPLDESVAISGHRFQMIGPEVVYETVDEETIIVNLDTGNYYDLNASGAYIFHAIECGTSLGEVAAGLCERYAVDRGTAAADVERLAGELLGEQLIVPAAEIIRRNGHATHVPVTSGGQAIAGSQYRAPVLGKYTDMQELLLLDPVHEVDEAGWPSTG